MGQYLEGNSIISYSERKKSEPWGNSAKENGQRFLNPRGGKRTRSAGRVAVTDDDRGYGTASWGNRGDSEDVGAGGSRSGQREGGPWPREIVGGENRGVVRRTTIGRGEKGTEGGDQSLLISNF